MRRKKFRRTKPKLRGLSKYARYLRRLKDDSNATRLALIAIIKSRITPQEFRRVLYGRTILSDLILAPILMTLALTERSLLIKGGMSLEQLQKHKIKFMVQAVREAFQKVDR